MNIVDRVKNILLSPKTEWEVINGESTGIQSLLVSYVLPLAIVAAIGSLLKGFLFAGVLSLSFHLVTGIIMFLSSLIGFYISSIVIDALAPSFGSEKNTGKSAQLVAYSSTPSYIAGLLSFIPWLGGLIGLAGWVYGIYLMYLGIGLIKKTPDDKKVVYMIVSFVVIIAVYFVIFAVLGAVLYTAFGLGVRSFF